MPNWITDPIINRIVTTAVQLMLAAAAAGPLIYIHIDDRRRGRRR